MRLSGFDLIVDTEQTVGVNQSTQRDPESTTNRSDMTINRTGPHRTHIGPHRARTRPEMTDYFALTTVMSRIKA